MSKTDLSTVGKGPKGRGGSERVPFAERPTCSVNDAVEASGLGRSSLYILMRDGQIKWVKIRQRRLIVVGSLLHFLGAA
jgi:hypothetical protein